MDRTPDTIAPRTAQVQWLTVHTRDSIAISLDLQQAMRVMGRNTAHSLLEHPQEHIMKLKIGPTLFAGAIAALIAGPISAASDTAKDGAYTPAPTKDESGQAERNQPTAVQPSRETPRLGGDPATRSFGDSPLYTRSADDLAGVEVVDRTDDKVGDVKQIVLAPDRRSAHAVIRVGGILGMGERDIMISLDDLTPIGDKLQMSATKEEAMAPNDEEPNADKYVEVKGDMPISGSIVEFSAFEQGKDASKRGAESTTPNMDAAKPAIAPVTPRVPQ